MENWRLSRIEEELGKLNLDLASPDVAQQSQEKHQQPDAPRDPSVSDGGDLSSKIVIHRAYSKKSSRKKMEPNKAAQVIKEKYDSPTSMTMSITKPETEILIEHRNTERRDTGYSIHLPPPPPDVLQQMSSSMSMPVLESPGKSPSFTTDTFFPPPPPSLSETLLKPSSENQLHAPGRQGPPTAAKPSSSLYSGQNRVESTPRDTFLSDEIHVSRPTTGNTFKMDDTPRPTVKVENTFIIKEIPPPIVNTRPTPDVLIQSSEQNGNSSRGFCPETSTTLPYNRSQPILNQFSEPGTKMPVMQNLSSVKDQRVMPSKQTTIELVNGENTLYSPGYSMTLGRINHPELKFNQPEMKINQSEPRFNQPEQKFNQPEPRFNQSEPKINQPEPRINQPEPTSDFVSLEEQKIQRLANSYNCFPRFGTLKSTHANRFKTENKYNNFCPPSGPCLSDEDRSQVELFYRSHKSRVFVAKCEANLFFGSARRHSVMVPTKSAAGRCTESPEDWHFLKCGIPVLVLDTGESRRQRRLHIILAEKGSGFVLWRDSVDHLTSYSMSANVGFHTMHLSKDHTKLAGFYFSDCLSATEFYDYLSNLTSDPDDPLLNLSNGARKKKDRKFGGTSGRKEKRKPIRREDISLPCCFTHVTKLDRNDGLNILESGQTLLEDQADSLMELNDPSDIRNSSISN